MKTVDPVYGDTHKKMQHAVFHKLANLPKPEAPHCQVAALNDVAHPKTDGLIKRFVADHHQLSTEENEKAIACANGEAKWSINVGFVHYIGPTPNACLKATGQFGKSETI